jgi:uncharacterized membrane protein YhaH (DUF805 family)
MVLAAGMAFALLFIAIDQLFGRDATLVLYPPFFATLLSLSVRRLHDQARVGGWLLALLVPVLGPLLIVSLLFVRRGTDGENQYGEDPRLVGRDYLTVAVYEST